MSFVPCIKLSIFLITMHRCCKFEANFPDRISHGEFKKWLLSLSTEKWLLCLQQNQSHREFKKWLLSLCLHQKKTRWQIKCKKMQTWSGFIFLKSFLLDHFLFLFLFLIYVSSSFDMIKWELHQIWRTLYKNNLFFLDFCQYFPHQHMVFPNSLYGHVNTCFVSVKGFTRSLLQHSCSRGPWKHQVKKKNIASNVSIVLQNPHY